MIYRVLSWANESAPQGRVMRKSTNQQAANYSVRGVAHLYQQRMYSKDHLEIIVSVIRRYSYR
jgi:hypothetical protein